jgi:Asp/Glu/hydantoin racemase
MIEDRSINCKPCMGILQMSLYIGLSSYLLCMYIIKRFYIFTLTKKISGAAQNNLDHFTKTK